MHVTCCYLLCITNEVIIVHNVVGKIQSLNWHTYMEARGFKCTPQPAKCKQLVKKSVVFFCIQCRDVN